MNTKERIIEYVNKTDLTNVKRIVIDFFKPDWMGYRIEYNENGGPKTFVPEEERVYYIEEEK